MEESRPYSAEVALHATDPIAHAAPQARRLALVERQTGRRHGLAAGRRTRVGSAADNEIVLVDRTVSGRHAVIEPGPRGTLVLTDLDSTNGTFVAGLRACRFELRPGASFLLGRAALLVVADDPPERPPEDELGIVGRSPPMMRVRRDILRFAPLGATVLVHGETGTGKELVARALHARSRLAAAPFVAFNAAAVDPHLVDSELFGHERGAFTGAVVRHRGIFEQAHGGTLFIDEVGELSLVAQARLLRVLETGELRPVGTERAISVRVRVVAATHRDLAALVREGRFRADLYFRLHELVLELPPLRARAADLPALCGHLLARVSEGHPRELTDAALARLRDYPWPGNVRQLLNVLHRAAVVASGPVIGADAIGEALAREPDAALRARRRAATPHPDARTIRSTLAACDGRLSPAARRLGVPRTTLRELVRRLGIDDG